MKKLLLLFTMLIFGIGSMWAEEPTHHVAKTGQNFLNETSLKAGVDAATGDYLVALQIHAGSTFYINNEGKAQSSFSTTGATTWIVEKTSDSKYLLKTFSGKYIKTLGGNNSTAATFTTNSSEALKFNPAQSTSTDGNMESGYVANKAIFWNVDGGSNRINTNGISGTSKTIFQNSGTGCWTCLFTYEVSLKYQVTFNCKVNETLIYTESAFGSENEALAVPDLPGYTASPSSYTVGTADATTNITYTASAYPVNFTRSQTFTRSDRHINSITFDIDGEDQYINNIYQDKSTKCYQDLTATTVKLPINTSVQPKFNMTGNWQHGFVYVDWNNDGDFTDEGELVSKINEDNPNLSTDMPSFTSPSTPGTYRMRIKTDWSSEDPGGNTGNDPHSITSGNHIISNGGMILDVTLELTEYMVTYVVKDENENVLFTSTPVATTLGASITTLPTTYQKAEFYDYNTLDITISDINTTATFTATPKESPLVKYTADTSDPVWYKMKLKDSNYPTYVANGTPNVTTPATNADNETVQWAFIGEPYAGFHIVCRAAKDGSDNYLVLGSGTTTGSSDTGSGVHATFAEEGTQNNELWDVRPSSYLSGGFFLFNGEGHALNERSTSNLAYWTGGNDKGSTFTVTEVLKGAALFNAIIEELETYPYGTGVNEYSLIVENQNYTTQAATIISGLKTQGYTEENLATAQLLLEGTSINLPTTGYYRIKGYSNNYITSNTAGSNASMNGTASENNIVYYSADKYLIFYGTGYGLYNTCEVAPLGSTLNSYTFSEGAQKGHYFIKSNYSGSKYCYDNTSNGMKLDRNTDPSSSNKTDWILEPVTSLPVETTEEGYTSFSAPVAVTIPDNCYAYIATGEGTDVINMTKVTGNVAANTGMIISTDGIDVAGPLSFEIAESGTEYNNNLLVANVAAANVSKANNYFFGKVDDKYVFTLLSGDGEYTLPGHKAYLSLNGNAARLSINWGGDDATGLSELSNEVIKLNDGKYYQNGTVIVVRNGVKYNVAGQTIK